MSTVMRPRGPLPRRIYWTRRFLLLVAAVALLGLLWWMLPGGGSSGATPAHPGAPTGSTAAGPPQSHPTTQRPTTQRPTTQQPTGSRPPAKTQQVPKQQPPTTEPPTTLPTGPCQPANVRLGLSAASAPPGAGTRVRVAMSTTDGSTCSLGITPALFEAKVEFGRQVAWQSTACPDELAARKVVVRPHPAVLYTFAWDGYVAADACSGSAKVAAPRRYRVVAALIGGDPQRGFFYVTEPNAARQ